MKSSTNKPNPSNKESTERIGVIGTIVAYILLAAAVILNIYILFSNFPMWAKLFATLGMIAVVVVFFATIFTKKRIIAAIAAILFLIALLFSTCKPINNSNNYNSDVSALNEQIAANQLEIDSLNQKIASDKDTISKLQSQIVPDEFRCSNCGGDLRIAGCTHKHDVAEVIKPSAITTSYIKPVPVTPVPEVPVTPVPEVPVTPVPEVPVTPEPEVPVIPVPEVPVIPVPEVPVVKDSQKPISSLSVDKTTVEIGNVVTYKITVTDNEAISAVAENISALFSNATVEVVSSSYTSNKKAYTAVVNVTYLTLGSKSVQLPEGFAVDTTGNKSNASNTVLVNVVDTAAPVVTLVSDKTTVTVNEVITLTSTANDNIRLTNVNAMTASLTGLSNIGSVNVVSNSFDSENKSNEQVVQYTFTKAGNYTVQLPAGYATDSSENVSEASTTVTITVTEPVVEPTDKIKPVVTINWVGTPTFKVGTNANFEIVAWDNEAISSFEVIASNINQTANATISNLVKVTSTKYTGTITFNEVGDYNIYVDAAVATDASGNTSEVSNTITGIITSDEVSPDPIVIPPVINDITKPVITLTGGNTIVNGGNIVLTVTATDNNGAVTLDVSKIDLLGLTQGLSIISVTKTSDSTADILLKATEVGSYATNVIQGVATDAKGNKSDPSNEALIFVSPATVSDAIIASTVTTEETTAPVTTTTPSIVTDTTSTPISSVTDNTPNVTPSVPQVEAPTTVATDTIVWE